VIVRPFFGHGRASGARSNAQGLLLRKCSDLRICENDQLAREAAPHCQGEGRRFESGRPLWKPPGHRGFLTSTRKAAVHGSGFPSPFRPRQAGMTVGTRRGKSIPCETEWNVSEEDVLGLPDRLGMTVLRDWVAEQWNFPQLDSIPRAELLSSAAFLGRG
jgi:hypothetical protein